MSEAEFVQSVGRRIREARSGNGYTQESFGAAVGKTPQTIRNWESGRALPSVKDLHCIGRLTKKQPSWFLSALNRGRSL